MKNMNDVNQLRLDVCALLGQLTALLEAHSQRQDADMQSAIKWMTDIMTVGAMIQHASQLEAWVTLRERIAATRWDCTIADSTLNQVLDHMDELEGES